MRPKVYIIKEQMIRGETGPVVVDYSAATQFGDIEFITRFDMPMYGKSAVQEVWNADALDFAQEYDERQDYIVTTGQPVAIFAIGWVLGKFNKVPRFLVWRREEGRYRVLNFDATMPVGQNRFPVKSLIGA